MTAGEAEEVEATAGVSGLKDILHLPSYYVTPCSLENKFKKKFKFISGGQGGYGGGPWDNQSGGGWGNQGGNQSWGGGMSGGGGYGGGKFSVPVLIQCHLFQTLHILH